MGEPAKRDDRHARTIKGPKAPVAKKVDRPGPIRVRMEVDLWTPRPEPGEAADEGRTHR